MKGKTKVCAALIALLLMTGGIYTAFAEQQVPTGIPQNNATQEVDEIINLEFDTYITEDKLVTKQAAEDNFGEVDNGLNR